MMRNPDLMLYSLTGSCDVVEVDVSSADYTYSGSAKVKGILVGDGTTVTFEKTNSDATTVDMTIAAPCELAIDGISKVYKTGTDATKIYLLTE